MLFAIFPRRYIFFFSNKRPSRGNRWFVGFVLCVLCVLSVRLLLASCFVPDLLALHRGTSSCRVHRSREISPKRIFIS